MAAEFPETPTDRHLGKTPPTTADDLSEVTILPDGRVYVFGMTMPLLELLATLPTREGRWQSLLHQQRAAESTAKQEHSS